MKFIKTWFVIFVSGFAALQAQAGVTFTSLISFNQTNGATPEAGLSPGSDGNFYGTTSTGGTNDDGTIFQLTSSGVFTSMISFDGTNGAEPRAGLIQGADGNFYGTTYNGGSNNFGTLFRLTTHGALTTLVTLSFSGGGYPIAGLIQDQNGNFYGTASIGGANSGGTVYEWATNGTLATLAAFDINGSGGNSPYAGLAQGADGNFYGTTFQGGSKNYGTIFQLTTNSLLTALVSFNNTNGANPYAKLVRGLDGNFYGTTYFGGSNGYGTIFKFATNGALTTLVSFDNTNGANPQGGLIQDSEGNFYGTTSAGGAYTNQLGIGYGTVFKLATNGTFSTLISFDGTNGASPEAGLIQGADGNFYGTTANGGTNGYGTIFRFSVAAPSPPKFLKIESMDGAVTLTWSATVGQDYQMLYKTNLTQAAWNNLNTTVTATNATMTTFDAAGSGPQRFYRILALP
ncbi:MAG: choice-of-anchor tandem repeat GloVer-containing protein [Limisphaerales bacterium]